MNNISTIQELNISPHIFWEYKNPEKLNLNESKELITEHVLQYGTAKEFFILEKTLGQAQLIDTAQKLRHLDPLVLNFLCTVYNIKKEDFRCYTLKLSTKITGTIKLSATTFISGLILLSWRDFISIKVWA